MEFDLQSPSTGRRYAVTKHELGKGEYGTVYLAVGDDQKQYACKLLQPKFHLWSYEKIEKFQKSLKLEIMSLMKSNHPNIIKFIDYLEIQKEDGFKRYLISEYCDGCNLKEFIQQKGKISETNAYPFFLGLALGLQYMHSQNITHRDIKPANIMLHQGVPKYIDFGFAKSIDEQREDQVQTVEVGSPQYMAPELLEETGFYNHKVDIWALGIIFYELLTGQFPWNIDQASDKQEMYNIICNDETVNFPNKIPISDKMKNLIIDMLKFQYDDRIDSNQLIQKLQN